MRRGARPWRWVAPLALVLAAGAIAANRAGPPPAPADRTVAMTPLTAGRPLTLAVLGTSLSARSRWPEAVARDLGSCLDRPVRLVRVAEPGATSAWGLGQVVAVAGAAPDLVLVEFAINDADLSDGLSLAESEANHRAIVRDLRAALPDARIVLLTMSPAQGLRGLMRPFLGRYYAAYGVVADETGAGLIDLYPRWLAVPRVDRGLADGLHPDDGAALAMIVPVVVGRLGLMAGRDCGP